MLRLDMLSTALQSVITIAAAMAAILIHYECLDRLNISMVRFHAKPRVRIVGGVVIAIIAHSLEVLVFALAYYLSTSLGHGELTGSFDGSLADYVYFSYATFTTVGFGDIVATEHVRILVGVESLTGFVLITWTASFLYLEMSRYWSHR